MTKQVGLSFEHCIKDVITGVVDENDVVVVVTTLNATTPAAQRKVINRYAAGLIWRSDMCAAVDLARKWFNSGKIICAGTTPSTGTNGVRKHWAPVV